MRNNFDSTPVQPTPRQLDVLRAIYDFTSERGYAPSIREIAGRIGVSSTHGVALHLRALSRKGMLPPHSRSARACVLTQEALDLLAAPRPSPPAGRAVPMLGRLGPSWVRGTIYFVEAVGAERVKIGFTKGDAEERARLLQTGCPFPLRVIATFRGSQRGESELHERFAFSRVAPNVEWFLLGDEIRAFLAAHGAKEAA